jgi:HAD superfamily hydrolase (TIGR01484 family)
MIFSYATARSLVTAAKASNGLNGDIPVIVYNGAFIINSLSKEILLSVFFNGQEISDIKETLTKFGVYPIVYSYIDGVEKFSFYQGYTNTGLEFFLNSRKGDIRRNPVDTIEELYRGRLFNISCIGNEAGLQPAYDTFRHDNRYTAIYQRDIYSHEQWLELLPAKATKASAILRLKDLLRCEKVISFGDGKNDIAMFEVSDECYAVDNAVPELKSIATGVIGANTVDGVARWLLDHVKRGN